MRLVLPELLAPKMPVMGRSEMSPVSFHDLNPRSRRLVSIGGRSQIGRRGTRRRLV